ncbi:MAG: hypothetical protein FWG57_05930 [Endomicrobia bacterium]|nr:hypothetical protein [Endomicrobiia bacterium]
MKKILFLLIMTVFVFSGCERNPAGALMYNGVNNSDPSSWANPFIIYRNGDIMTRVLPMDDAIGAFTNIWEKYRQDGNVLEARYTGVSHSGFMSFKMKWTGQPSERYDTGATANNVAFWLTTSTGTSKDLSAAGYTKMSFWYKSELASGTEVVINVFGHDYPARDFVITGSSGWTLCQLNISSYSSNAVENYIIVTMQPVSPATSCNGGTIYLDDIRLSK